MKKLVATLLALGSISSFASSKCTVAYLNHPELNNKNNPISSDTRENVATIRECALWASSFATSGATVEFSYESDSDEDLGSAHVFSITGAVKSKINNSK